MRGHDGAPQAAPTLLLDPMAQPTLLTLPAVLLLDLSEATAQERPYAPKVGQAAKLKDNPLPTDLDVSS